VEARGRQRALGPGGGVSIFCGVLWGGISDRVGRGRGAALVYFFLSASYLIMALLKSNGGFYFSAIVFGLCAWSIPTIMAATAGDLSDPGWPRPDWGLSPCSSPPARPSGPGQAAIWPIYPLFHHALFAGRLGLPDRRTPGLGIDKTRGP